MSERTWPMVCGPFRWEELLVGSHEGFRRVETLEVDFLVETEDVRRSPRGWGEAGVRTAIVRDRGDDVELDFGDTPPSAASKVQRVSKAALRAMLELGS